MRSIEIDTIEDFDRCAARSRSMRGWQVQDLDLTGRTAVLGRLDPAGALFLGCRIPDNLEDRLRTGGALVFPAVPDVPFDAYRATLYTPEELYDGIDRGYDATPDARIYAWSVAANRHRPGGTTVHDSLAMALHDNAVDDALSEYVRGRRIVGVMGGHALERGEPAYDDAARLGAELAGAGYTVATGGGPGAMEAANLGAAVAGVADLDEALARVATVPSYRPSVTDWARAGLVAVGARSGMSLGVPTWFYGHEPPNPFCGAVAKYFRNAIREDILLHVCRAGLVFLPGAAGTVQEIFQAACGNYHAVEGEIAPMVLVGKEFWSERLQAWPLLSALAAGGPLASRLALVDSTDEVRAALGEELGRRAG
ncbi:LOG family protein [Nocardioides terrisoli]|uniref:LOG family protein n=1 Tax=Nocardioides terrisoli TaxID=3388267 RepID=UPI00287BA700|nr:Rossmann fold nucleotide-binding protein [Nocardioides marmorisolisilvae]